MEYIFGLSGPSFSPRKSPSTDDICTRRAIANLDVLRDYTETRYAAKSWIATRRVVARIEATEAGLDVRYVVTNIAVGSAEWIYDSLYCARGQAENLIKRHKTQLASDRTSCRSPLANQIRLILHTAAYWLMLTVRDAIPKVRQVGHRRVRDAASAALEDRRPCQRDHQPDPPGVRRGMSRRRPVPRLARRAAAARSLTGGACRPRSPNPSLKRVAKYGRQAVKSRRQSCAPRQRRCAAASIGPKNRTLTNRTG